MKRFHQLREAFEVLSDVQRRRLYDSSAEFKTTERPNRSNSKKYTARNEKHEESDAFDEEDKYFRRSYWSMRRPTQGEDVYESIKINLLESVKGVTKKLRFTRKCVCMDC
jgi:DnaJ-class molecular chaperone